MVSTVGERENEKGGSLGRNWREKFGGKLIGNLHNSKVLKVAHCVCICQDEFI